MIPDLTFDTVKGIVLTVLKCIADRISPGIIVRGKMEETKRAILVVSFGTSYEETRKKTIEKIEEDVRKAYSRWGVYRAWTSGMICKRILKRDGIFIPNVQQALEQMMDDGVREVVVQPTHVMNGIENDRMIADITRVQDRFERIIVSEPLLSGKKDCDQVIQAVACEIPVKKNESLVLMGHGTEHHANTVYAALDYQFKDMGYSNIHMGTVESYPTFDSVLKQVNEQKPERVILAPFMIVAGDHANNDLFGSDEDSWKSRFESAGYEVICFRKGLGEYPGVRSILLKHLQAAAGTLEV